MVATLASQPAAGLSLSFIITIVIMTLGWSCLYGWQQKVAAEFGSHALFVTGHHKQAVKLAPISQTNTIQKKEKYLLANGDI